MTTLTQSSEIPPTPQRMSLIKQAWAINKPTTLLVIVTALLSILTTVGMFTDARTILGQPVWAKSAKFAFSIVIYGATLLWLFSYVPRSRWVKGVLNITGVALLIEIILIVIQAFRGERMHYNTATPIDMILWRIMSATIYTLFAVSIFAVFKLLRTKLPTPAFAWGLKLGLLVTVFAGYGVANLMVTPSDSQMEAMIAGEEGATDIIGAHTVGADDGGPGLPLLGWSTTHGDLRPAHFFGLHALQIIPLFGLFLSRRRDAWLKDGHKVMLVALFSLAYTGFIGLVAWQALRAEPLIYPSATTMMAFAGLVGVTLSAVFLTLRHSYKSYSG